MAEALPVVFVVDDDHSFRRALERMLRVEGYAVEVFASARAYLERAPYDGPGCLLLDLAMPGIGGLELQARIARDEQALPIVFVSGHPDVKSGVHAMKMGAVDFLTKPVDSEVLLGAIRTALSRQAARLHARARLALLSRREHQVLGLVVQGLLNKQIAAQLGIAEKTVKVHRARVMEKTSSASLADLVRLAAEDAKDIPFGTS